MNANMPSETLKLLRITIAIQLLVAAWFIFSPDVLPNIIKEAQMQNDQPIYETLDSIIVPLAHLQTLLCFLLWWPNKFTCWAFAIVLAAITGLGAFAGPSILSAIDGIFGYMQALATGGTLCLLYLHNFFSFRSQAGVINVNA